MANLCSTLGVLAERDVLVPRTLGRLHMRSNAIGFRPRLARSTTQEGLRCYRRSGLEDVPGCSGDGAPSEDYCARVPPDFLFYYGSDPTDRYPLSMCEGDCDGDGDCGDGLVCQLRHEYEAVEGCQGTYTTARLAFAAVNSSYFFSELRR